MIISNYLAAWVIDKYFLYEEEKTTRLVKDIISKFRLCPDFVMPLAYLKQSKVRKVYNFAMRGGASEDNYLFLINDSENTSVQVEDDPLLHILATEYYNFFTFLLVQIAQRLQVGGTTSRGVKFILTKIQRYLLYVIKKHGIQLAFYVDNVSGQVIIISTVCRIASGINGAFLHHGLGLGRRFWVILRQHYLLDVSFIFTQQF